MNNLLLEIAKCCEVDKAKADVVHPCNKIVCSQNDLGITDYQLPEPWNGHLDTAEILFISSNPSIDPNENYPTASWKDEDIVSFFENRFDNIIKFNGNTQNFWYNINKWTGLVLGKEDLKENLLKNYAVSTEAVHCKSKNSNKKCGYTPCCLKTCFYKWLREILKLYKGKYVIVVGTKLGEYIKGHLDEENYIGKKFAYTPHPSERKKGLTTDKRKRDILNQLK